MQSFTGETSGHCVSSCTKFIISILEEILSSCWNFKVRKQSKVEVRAVHPSRGNDCQCRYFYTTNLLPVLKPFSKTFRMTKKKTFSASSLSGTPVIWKAAVPEQLKWGGDLQWAVNPDYMTDCNIIGCRFALRDELGVACRSSDEASAVGLGQMRSRSSGAESWCLVKFAKVNFLYWNAKTNQKDWFVCWYLRKAGGWSSSGHTDCEKRTNTFIIIADCF